MTFEIRNRYDDSAVVYSSETANDMREAVLEAVGKKANLRSANLRSADLRSADLRSANLRSADLRSANLSSANLRSADLSSANLSSANLRSVKADFFEVLLNAPGEIAGLRAKLIAGEIDGSCYEPECGMACLVGTIAIMREANYQCLTGIQPDSSRAAETWFYNIRPGGTPDKNAVAAITLDWIDEFEAKIGGFLALAVSGRVPHAQ